MSCQYVTHTPTLHPPSSDDPFLLTGGVNLGVEGSAEAPPTSAEAPIAAASLDGAAGLLAGRGGAGDGGRGGGDSEFLLCLAAGSGGGLG